MRFRIETILNNTINSNDKDGISFEMSCSNNTISDNIITGNGHSGIYLSGFYKNIIQNNISSDNWRGITLDNICESIIIYNQFDSNEDHGLYSIGGYENFIAGNICQSNGDDGIYLTSSQSLSNIIIFNNICNYNTDYGIHVYSSSNVIISENTCIENSVGISVGDYVSISTGSIVYNNYCSGNTEFGIYLRYSCENTVAYNTLYSNQYGIKLWDSANDNIFYLNNLINNTINSVNSEGVINNWHSPVEKNYEYKGVTYTNYLGNYYSEHNLTDANEDGITDTIFDLPGDEPDDEYPLVNTSDNYIAENEFSELIESEYMEYMNIE